MSHVGRNEPVVIELVVLHEGDGGLGRFLRFVAGVCGHRVALLCRRVRIVRPDVHHGRFGLRLLDDDDVAAEAHDRADDDAESHLADYLESALEPLLVFAEYLDVVVGETEQAEPYGRHYHELDIDVAQVAEEYYRDEHGSEDYQSSHRGGSAFLHLSFQTEVANLFAYLVPPEPFDYLFAEDGADEQRKDDCTYRAERKVAEQARSRQVEMGSEVFEQRIKHLRKLFFGLSFGP